MLSHMNTSRTLIKFSRRWFSKIQLQTTRSRVSPGVTRLDLIDENEACNRSQFKDEVNCVLLDWSGTIMDAHSMAPFVALRKLFANHDIPITMEQTREHMGLRLDEHIWEIIANPVVKQRWTEVHGYVPDTKSKVDKSVELFEEFVPILLEALPQYSTLLPGVADTVELLTSYKIKMGSTTGFYRAMLDVVLAETKKQGFELQYTVAGDDDKEFLGHEIYCRPSPHMIYRNMAHFDEFPIESIVKVDNTKTGIAEGLNAGCWTVGVYAYSNYTNVESLEQWELMSDEEQEQRQLMARDVLESSGAHYVIHSLTDLPLVIEEIGERLSLGEKPQGLPVEEDDSDDKDDDSE